MQNQIIDTVRLDIGKSAVNVCIYVRAGDTRTLEFILINNGKPIDVEDAVQANIILNRGTTQSYQSMTRYGNRLRYTLHDYDVATIGQTACTIQVVFSDGEVATSPGFDMIVEDVPIDMSGVIAQSAYTAITTLQATVEKINTECASNAAKATAAATTAQSILAETEEAITKAEEATTAATTATTKAEEATTAATTATTKAEEATTAANAATSQAEEATTTANEALSEAESLGTELREDRDTIDALKVDVDAYTRMMQSLGITGFTSETNLAGTTNYVV